MFDDFKTPKKLGPMATRLAEPHPMNSEPEEMDFKKPEEAAADATEPVPGSISCVLSCPT